MNPEPVQQAKSKRSWWPGWIWAIPIAAVFVVGWLGLRSITSAGPGVTVVFPVVADVKAGNTDVTFQGLKVGEVSSVQLEHDLHHMRVRLSLASDMAHDLGRGTQFWLIGRSPSLTNLSSLKALLSGVSIGMQPAPGPKLDEYQGLPNEPVLKYGETGMPIILHADKLGSVQEGTPIYYRDQQVGVVERHRMADGHDFVIDAFIDDPYGKLVHDGTRFWRAGPIHVSMQGGGPTVQFQSVPALFQGAIAFETPDDPAAGPQAKAGHRFELFDDEDAARNAPAADGVAYRLTFARASGVPPVNAPVTLMGKRVGSVTESELEYLPDQRMLDVRATIVIEPHDVALPSGTRWTDPRHQMDDMMRALIAQGLKASLVSSPPVIGGQQVALRIGTGTPGALGDGPIPDLPTEGGGSGVSGMIAQVDDALAELKAIPLKQIGDNVEAISSHVDRLASSPDLSATLAHVDRATANLERVASDMRRQVPPALEQMRSAVADARDSLSAMQGLLSARGSPGSGPESGDLPQTLYEVTRAARSLRELADLLDRNPSAVLTGR